MVGNKGFSLTRYDFPSSRHHYRMYGSRILCENSNTVDCDQNKSNSHEWNIHILIVASGFLSIQSHSNIERMHHNHNANEEKRNLLGDAEYGEW